jgi:hypothetical protein
MHVHVHAYRLSSGYIRKVPAIAFAILRFWHGWRELGDGKIG